ncbi:MAG: hypothetical protein ACXV3D_09180 [Halobacteriota archaeon]
MMIQHGKPCEHAYVQHSGQRVGTSARADGQNLDSRFCGIARADSATSAVPKPTITPTALPRQFRSPRSPTAAPQSTNGPFDGCKACGVYHYPWARKSNTYYR